MKMPTADHPEQSVWCWLKSRLFGVKIVHDGAGPSWAGTERIDAWEEMYCERCDWGVEL